MTVGQSRAEQEPGRVPDAGGAGPREQDGHDDGGRCEGAAFRREPGADAPRQHERGEGAAFQREPAGPHRSARPQGAARGRSARTAWTGAVALAVTGGVLVSASASVPTPGTVLPGIAAPPSASTGPADHAQAGPSPARAVAVRDATTHDDVSVDQVLAVLDRAERALRSAPSPDIAQAAAELGMLYTTYDAQEVARSKAGGTGVGDLARVTFDDVAVAAMRLANMLDPTSPTAFIEMRADAGSTLRRSLLRTVAAHGGSTVGYANGRIPADVLCPLEFAPGHMLRCDAAERLTALSAAFERRFGYPIPLTDSYRSFASQVAVKGTKPHLAAIPGTSDHGWGLAVDLDDPIADGASAEYVWLRLHGPDYGWDNPSWARLDGAKPEPWHFEFFAAGSIPNRAIDPADVGTWSPGDAASPTFVPAGTSPKEHSVHDGAAKPRGGQDHGAAAPAEPGNGASTPPAGTSPQAPTEPSEPAPSKPVPSEPAPSKPAPAEPPAHEEPAPEEPGSPADPGLLDDVVGGTVGLVDGVVGGVVGGLLGTDGAASSPDE